MIDVNNNVIDPAMTLNVIVSKFTSENQGEFFSLTHHLYLINWLRSRVITRQKHSRHRWKEGEREKKRQLD